jgi:hypothetical protein
VITDFSGRGPEKVNAYKAETLIRGKDILGEFVIAKATKRGFEDEPPIIMEARFDPSRGIALADVRGVGIEGVFDMTSPETHRPEGDIVSVDDLVEKAAVLAVYVAGLGQALDNVRGPLPGVFPTISESRILQDEIKQLQIRS